MKTTWMKFECGAGSRTTSTTKDYTGQFCTFSGCGCRTRFRACGTTDDEAEAGAWFGLKAGIVGKFARSIESGWLGRVVAVEQHPDLGGELLKMEGVNELVLQIGGGSLESCIEPTDLQWFAFEDLRFANMTPRKGDAS